MPTKQDLVINFSVTQDDIDAALLPLSRINVARDCPIGQALFRAIGRHAYVGWLEASIYWEFGQKPTIYKHNYEFRIKRFDTTGVMEPFNGALTRVG
jgi:hypothetical protein